MSSTERIVNASPEAVWKVLSDGWLYPLWVVGAARIRGVDASWPAPGSRLHHSAGVWPALLDDETRVLGIEPGRRVQLRAKGWPLGEADVVIELEEAEGGTRVRLREDAAAGPGKLLPKPLRTPLISWRNTETLRRLALLVEGREKG